MSFNMSVLSFASVLSLLLASFQYACYARPYPTGATTVHIEDSPKQSNSTTDKVESKMNLTDDDQNAAGQMQHQTASSAIRKGISLKDSNTEDNAEVELAATSHSKSHINHSSKKRKDRVKAGSRTGGGGRETTATYKVPRTKRGEKEPGFNLDYLPPRVHPPHHN